MRRFLDYLYSLWSSPSSFESRPFGYFRNQMGHMLLIGFMPGLVLDPGLWYTVPIAYLFVVEFPQVAFFKGSVKDSVEDAVYVTLGAMSFGLGSELPFMVGLVLMAIGVTRRTGV